MDLPPRAETQPAYERFRFEGAYHRRRVSVPRTTQVAHRALVPIAMELAGHVYDDDGRATIEWLEAYWPLDLAGHGRNDAFRWTLVGSTDIASVFVLITCPLDDSPLATLDVVLSPRGQHLHVLPAPPRFPGPVSMGIAPEGVHYWVQKPLEEIDEAFIRALIEAAGAAIVAAREPHRQGRSAMQTRRTIVSLRRLTAMQWAKFLGGWLVTGVCAAYVIDDRSTQASLFKGCIIVVFLASGYLVHARTGASGRRRWEDYIQSEVTGPYHRQRPPRGLEHGIADERLARLEEGRDIKDYVQGEG